MRCGRKPARHLAAHKAIAPQAFAHLGLLSPPLDNRGEQGNNRQRAKLLRRIPQRPPPIERNAIHKSSVFAIARYFSPNFNAMMNAEMRRFRERPPEIEPAIDGIEAYLVRTFLRRYVTYCARRGRFAAMNGAARLFAVVATPTR